MRGKIGLGMLVLAAGCTVQAPPAPAPPPANAGPGPRALYAQQMCSREAIQKCPAATTYCESFRRSYIEACMIRDGVPPEYVMVLTR